MVTNNVVAQLIEKKSPELLTITMPAFQKGEETKQNKITYKNLLQQAEAKLEKRGKKPDEITAFLKEARDLIDQPLFWAHQEGGLVVYIENGSVTTYSLPYSVRKQVYLHDHFLITPLLPMLSLEGTFAILALSRKSLRLLHCTRDDVTDITPQGISRSVDQYLEVTPEKQLQFHTGAEGKNAQFFGHGSGNEDKKVITEQYFREVEKGVTELMNMIGEPLILIGLEENLSTYHSFQRYSRTMEQSVTINPDNLEDRELIDAGFEKIKEYFLKDLYKALRVFSESTDDKFSNNMSEIIRAAFEGRANTILLSPDEQHFGVVDPDSGEVQFAHEPGEEDIDLINWLAIQGFKTGCGVFMLPKHEMPNHANVAAEFRY